MEAVHASLGRVPLFRDELEELRRFALERDLADAPLKALYETAQRRRRDGADAEQEFRWLANLVFRFVTNVHHVSAHTSLASFTPRGYRAGYVIVGHGREAGHRFVTCIHQDGHHFARAVLVGELVDRDRRSFATEIFRHLGRAGPFGFLCNFIREVNVNVDRDDVTGHKSILLRSAPAHRELVLIKLPYCTGPGEVQPCGKCCKAQGAKGQAQSRQTFGKFSLISVHANARRHYKQD
jgi:hypothetical protein